MSPRNEGRGENKPAPAPVRRFFSRDHQNPAHSGTLPRPPRGAGAPSSAPVQAPPPPWWSRSFRRPARNATSCATASSFAAWASARASASVREESIRRRALGRRLVRFGHRCLSPRQLRPVIVHCLRSPERPRRFGCQSARSGYRSAGAEASMNPGCWGRPGGAGRPGCRRAHPPLDNQHPWLTGS